MERLNGIAPCWREKKKKKSEKRRFQKRKETNQKKEVNDEKGEENHRKLSTKSSRTTFMKSFKCYGSNSKLVSCCDPVNLVSHDLTLFAFFEYLSAILSYIV
jgi:hypothetical protein